MERFLFLIVISLFTLSNNILAQEIDYLRKANEAFIKGNYSYAVTMYKMYYVETDKDVSELQHQAELCRDYLKKADDAALTKDYATASVNYQKILELNPDDASVKAKLSNLKSDVSSSGLKLGQEYMGGRIAYIDNTGKHGFVITSISKDTMTHDEGLKKTPKDSRVPTIRELCKIAPCAEMFDLFGMDVWSISQREKTDYYHYISYTTVSLGNIRVSGSHKKKSRHYFIYIKDF